MGRPGRAAGGGGMRCRRAGGAGGSGIGGTEERAGPAPGAGCRGGRRRDRCRGGRWLRRRGGGGVVGAGGGGGAAQRWGAAAAMGGGGGGGGWLLLAPARRAGLVGGQARRGRAAMLASESPKPPLCLQVQAPSSCSKPSALRLAVCSAMPSWAALVASPTLAAALSRNPMCALSFARPNGRGRA